MGLTCMVLFAVAVAICSAEGGQCLAGGLCAAKGSEGSGSGQFTCSCTETGFQCESADAPVIIVEPPVTEPPPPPPPPPPPVTEPPPPPVTEPPPPPVTEPPPTEPPPRDPCNPNPCKNFETCHSEVGEQYEYTCTCPPEYTGCSCDIKKVTECPAGFTAVTGEEKSCYKIITTPADWDTQEKACKDLYTGSGLGKITSTAEDKAIVAHIKTALTPAERANCDKGYFIGLQRAVRKDCKTGFEWKSITTCSGEIVSYKTFNWATGEPNCSKGESCVHLWPYANYKWNDLSCDNKVCAICELSIN